MQSWSKHKFSRIQHDDSLYSRSVQHSRHSQSTLRSTNQLTITLLGSFHYFSHLRHNIPNKTCIKTKQRNPTDFILFTQTYSLNDRSTCHSIHRTASFHSICAFYRLLLRLQVVSQALLCSKWRLQSRILALSGYFCSQQ